MYYHAYYDMQIVPLSLSRLISDTKFIAGTDAILRMAVAHESVTTRLSHLHFTSIRVTTIIIASSLNPHKHFSNLL